MNRLSLHEYESLHDYFSGPEASFYYAKFLKSQHQRDKAMHIFKEIVDSSKHSGKHFNELYKDIINQAKNEIRY